MALARGSDLQFRYLVMDPARSWIVGREPYYGDKWLIVLLVGPLFVLSGLSGIFIVTKVGLPQRFLLAEGLIAQGHVTGVRGRRSGPVHDVSYQFQVDGKDYGGLFSDPSEKEWATDASVTILYDRDDPRRHARYPMPWVRIKDLFPEPANGHPSPELTLLSTPRPLRLTVPRVLVWSVVPAMLLILLSAAVSIAKTPSCSAWRLRVS